MYLLLRNRGLRCFQQALAQMPSSLDKLCLDAEFALRVASAGSEPPEKRIRVVVFRNWYLGVSHLYGSDRDRLGNRHFNLVRAIVSVLY